MLPVWRVSEVFADGRAHGFDLSVALGVPLATTGCAGVSASVTLMVKMQRR
jgi:hypothetical protein